MRNLFTMNKVPTIFLLKENQLSDPEARAMLAGFYSRSTESVLTKIENKSIQEIKESLKKYAIGYGHKSLLDMANTPLMFIEGVSILASKALEFFKLGNYQETSTRYLDFSKQEFYDPLITKTDISSYLIQQWLNIYSFCQLIIRKELERKFPKEIFKQQQGELFSERVYQNTLNAKVFDITRSLLPAAMKTNVGISLTLSSAKEWLGLLIQHPLPEVRYLADLIFIQLHETFPYSFDSLVQFYQKSKLLPEAAKHEFYFYNDDTFVVDETKISCFILLEAIDSFSDEEYKIWSLLCERKNPDTFFQFPSFLAKLGSIKIEFTLDYGSWRDLQRHRNVLYNQSSILTGGIENFAFEEYFDCLDNKELKKYLELAIFKQFEAIRKLKNAFELSEEEYQYLYPLGTKVNCQLVCSLPELVYILELRSSPSVHYTLRQRIQEIYSKLPKVLKTFVALNKESSFFDLKRGTEDIFEIEEKSHA